ncbi:hypothetical protein GCM10022271_15030 [Corallibacter vietnamensis]|uniref:Uncharacterized protein n=1 Tax=Corallibacter vietnamensis TaxID=904130 RepID=A0ABP7H6T4_9FLAO
MAYYELNIDYIIKTYCINTDKPELKCNGKCHLAKQLNLETQNSEDENELNSIAVFEGFLPVFNQIQTYILPKKPKLTISKHIVDGYFNNYFFLKGESQYKPPQRLI